MLKNNKNIQRAWLAALLLTPIVLWILPSGFFDGSDVILCPSRLFFNIECFGCGMTRAVMHMHHLEIEDAIYYNNGVVVVFPALVVIWGMWVYKAVRRLRLVKSSAAGQENSVA
jgi:hypothetical protein